MLLNAWRFAWCAADYTPAPLAALVHVALWLARGGSFEAFLRWTVRGNPAR